MKKRLEPAALIVLLLAACGGSGVPEDTLPTDPPVVGAEGIDRFLLFPNPQVQDDDRFQTDTEAYALAYYAAVDPGVERDTLQRWLAKNRFGQPGGEEVTAVFGDTRDLGYGRRMRARRNADDGTIAFVVENYLVNPGGGYGDTPLSIEAAAVQDARWRVGVNAIEVSPAPGGGDAYAKFFNFNPSTGARDTTVDLDGRGRKALPGVCLNCHGGRGDALGADGRFRGPRNSASPDGGDALGKLHAFEVSSLRFLDRAPWRRADQEAALKRLNQFVLCSWPQPDGQAHGVPTTLCSRRQLLLGDLAPWQGSAAPMLIAAYGGDGMPNAAYADTLLPAGWAGQELLYRSVVAPACRTCHLMRGTGLQSDIDFDSFAKFQGYAGRIKAHAVDRGNMPLAKIVYDAYWASEAPELMARFLELQGETGVRDGAGAPLRPGRPVADPGPSRAALSGTDVFVSARNSLNADAWQWTLDAPVPTGATLSGANQREAVLRVGVGDHFLTLRVSRGGVQSAPATLRVVGSGAAPNQNNASFGEVRSVVQGTACNGCHVVGDTSNPLAFNTPDAALYAELRSRINFTDIVASPLLRKPAGEHHNGGQRTGFDASATPGDGARTAYDLILNWALRGAPPP
jgi:hypothetical protein